MYKTKFLRWVADVILFNLLKDFKLIKPYHLLLFRVSFAIITALSFFTNNLLLILSFLTVYQFVFLLDYVDGSIARYRKQFSPKWRRVDRTSHYLISTLFLLGISYYSFSINYDFPFLVIGLIGSISIFFTFIIDSIWLSSRISFDKFVEIHNRRGVISIVYSFLPVDGSFTIFYFSILASLIFPYVLNISIIFLSSLYLLTLFKKTYNLLIWKKKQM